MTVSSESNKIIYQGNGATTSWPFTFSQDGDTDSIQVYYTDADGVITELPTNQYTLTLNAASGTNPTGIGGTVVYPLVGSPIAIGTLLTIIRTMALTQPTSIANQGTLWPPAIEAALDDITMQLQQLNELIGRQITVAVSDDEPEALPPAAQRADMLMGFDADGNPIAVELTDAGQVLVSSAMIPVVEAATVALARTELGLGDMSVLAIGHGLFDNSGEVSGHNPIQIISSNTAIDIDSYNNYLIATVAATLTLDAAADFYDGWQMTVKASGGAVTIAIDAADSFFGGTVGQSIVIPQGTEATIVTDGVNTWHIVFVDITPQANIGNFTIDATVAGNNLTVTLLDRSGNNPTPSSPIKLPFRSSDLANGSTVFRQVSTAASIVASNGATFGTSNSTPFGLWLVAFDDAGTIRLALINCLSGVNTYPLGKTPLDDSTLISAAATAAWTLYSQGAGVTDKPYLILAKLIWESGLPTAGAWSAEPTVIDLYAPGKKLPGDVIQNPVDTDGAVNTSGSGIAFDNTPPLLGEGGQFLTQAIVPTSGSNLIEVDGQALLAMSAGITVSASITRDALAESIAAMAQSPTVNTPTMIRLFKRILAGQITSTTFRLQAGSAAGTTTFNGSGGTQAFGGVANSFLSVKEIMA